MILLRRYGHLVIIFLVAVVIIMEVFYKGSADAIVNSGLQGIKMVRLQISVDPTKPYSPDHLPLEPSSDNIRPEHEPATVGDRSDSLPEEIVIFKGRLKLNAGRCIGVDGLRLVVTHCDSDQDQFPTFTLYNNKSLIYDLARLCVTYTGIITGLGECNKRHKPFALTDNKLLAIVKHEIEVKCLVTKEKYPCLGDQVYLSTHCDEENSRVLAVKEAAFQKDIKALITRKLPSPLKRNYLNIPCDFQACSLNIKTEPVRMLPEVDVTRCTDPSLCVTVVTKTARRPHLVIRLAESIRRLLGYDLKIICYDDGPEEHPQEVKDELEVYQIDYIVGWADMGISAGRNLALKRVQTKYFLLVDDDHVFTASTNITKMVDILDRTDATLVGGKFEDTEKFAGTFSFNYYRKMKVFSLYSGLCQGPIEGLGSCEQCDVTSNIFLAKLDLIAEFGGWSEELKIAEHTDFFVKLKAYGLKVVYCDDLMILNQQEKGDDKDYHKLRYSTGRKHLMYSLMAARYNVNGVYWCSHHSEDSLGEPKCTVTKHKISFC